MPWLCGGLRINLSSLPIFLLFFTFFNPSLYVILVSILTISLSDQNNHFFCAVFFESLKKSVFRHICEFLFSAGSLWDPIIFSFRQIFVCKLLDL